jgi:glucans biosynthesis protein
VENNLRYNPVTKGWRLTLRVKAKDTNKSVDMKAYLLREVPAEPGKEPAAIAIVADKADKKVQKKADIKPAPAPASTDEKADVAKADATKPADAAKPADAKAGAVKTDAAKTDVAKADAAKDKDGKETPQPATEAAPTNPEPAKNIQVLTETWSYQLPADE